MYPLKSLPVRIYFRILSLMNNHMLHIITVPDLGRRDRDVRRTISTGKPRGSGIGMGREWGGDEKGKVSLRATWGQGGQDRITPKEGFQVSKREMEGKVTGN
jgi:hypothetical protein